MFETLRTKTFIEQLQKKNQFLFGNKLSIILMKCIFYLRSESSKLKGKKQEFCETTLVIFICNPYLAGTESH